MIQRCEGWRWQYKIVGKTAKDFRKDYDTDSTIALLREVKTLFTDKTHRQKLNRYIARFEEISKLREEDYYEFKEKHNRLLERVWDFFDDEGIFIDL